MNVITINGEDVVVAKLPQQLQSQIALLEHVSTETMEARKKLAVLEHAYNSLSQTVTAAYSAHKEALKSQESTGQASTTA